MRRMPTWLALSFVGITLARVAALAGGALGAGVLGWPFAVGLGLGVYMCSYWLKVADSHTRVAAGVSLGFFALADLIFNMSEVYRGMLATGAWADRMLQVAGIVYAAFPTIAVGLLGWLQGRVDKLPPAPVRKGAILPRIRLWIAAQIDGNMPESSGNMPESNNQAVAVIPASAGTLPERAGTSGKVPAWRDLDDETRRNVAGMTTEEIQRLFHISDRTARNWRSRASVEVVEVVQ